MVDTAGRVIGAHPGHRRFTVGQRRGLGVAAGKPVFVVAKDAGANRVVVGPREQLARRTVRLEPAVLYRPGAVVDRVKLRYRSAAVPGRLSGAPAAGAHGTLVACLEEDAFGVAAGPDRIADAGRARGRARDDCAGPRPKLTANGRTDSRGDPRDLPLVLRVARSPAHAVGFPRPVLV